jgi:hypothetical protein
VLVVMTAAARGAVFMIELTAFLMRVMLVLMSGMILVVGLMFKLHVS